MACGRPVHVSNGLCKFQKGCDGAGKLLSTRHAAERVQLCWHSADFSVEDLRARIKARPTMLTIIFPLICKRALAWILPLSML